MKMPRAAKRRKRSHVLKIVPERIRGKQRFKLAGYYINGRRVRKYFETEEAAKTFVDAENIRRENLGARAANISGDLAEDALRAVDKLRSTQYTLLDAARIVAAADHRLAPHSIRIEDAINNYVADVEKRQRSVTVAQLIAQFLDNRRAKRRSAIYLRDLKIRLARFEQAMGSRVVADITAQDVESWIHSLNIGPQTQNNFRAVLSTVWSFAVRRGYASANVVQMIDKASIVRDNIPTFTVDELDRLLKAAPTQYLPVLAISAFAGLRPEEVSKLRWEDINFDDSTIRVNATAAKTRKKRFVDMSENLIAWLRPYGERSGRVAPPNLQKLRRATMKAAKIEHWPQDVLRHTFASVHYAFHKNPAHTALLLGHRDQDMLLNHYRDALKPAEAAKYWGIFPEPAADNILPMKAAGAA
jgi:integrase